VADVVAAGNVRQRFASVPSRPRFLLLVRGELELSPQLHASGLGTLPAFAGERVSIPARTPPIAELRIIGHGGEDVDGEPVGARHVARYKVGAVPISAAMKATLRARRSSLAITSTARRLRHSLSAA
jgi:hypothetical protein